MKVEFEKLKIIEEGNLLASFTLNLLDVPFIKIRGIMLRKTKAGGTPYLAFPFKTFHNPDGRTTFYNLVELPTELKRALTKSCFDFLQEMKKGGQK